MAGRCGWAEFSDPSPRSHQCFCRDVNGPSGLLLLSTITLYHWSTYLFSKCKHPATRSMRGQPVAKNSRRRHRLYVVLPRQGCGMSVRETALNYIPESFPSLSMYKCLGTCIIFQIYYTLKQISPTNLVVMEQPRGLLDTAR